MNLKLALEYAESRLENYKQVQKNAEEYLQTERSESMIDLGKSEIYACKIAIVELKGLIDIFKPLIQL